MDSSRRKVLRGGSGIAVMALAMAAGLVKPGAARHDVEQGRVRHEIVPPTR